MTSEPSEPPKDDEPEVIRVISLEYPTGYPKEEPNDGITRLV